MPPISVGDAVVTIGGDTSKLDSKLSGIGTKLNKIGQNAGAAGRSLVLMGAPVAALSGFAVSTFAKFEQSMARVQAVSNATAEEFEALKNIAKEMGRTTVFTANQSADALSFLAMAGMTATEAIGSLPSVLQLAAAGGLELADAADIVTNVMAGFGLEIDELDKANDVLVTGFTSANTNLQQLGQAFKFAGPVARAAGISFEETTAVLALLGNAGLQATMAGTGLRGAITRLLNPSGEAQKVIERLGIQILDSAGDMLPFVDIVGQLEKSGLSAGDAMEIFGQRAGPAMLALVGQGSEALRKLTGEMENSGGTAERIALRQLDTFSGSMTLLKSQVESVALQLGETLAPRLRALVERVGPIVTQIGEWVEKNPQLILAISAAAGAMLTLGGALVGLSLILPGIVALGPLVGGAFSLMLGPIGLVAAAIAALVFVFVTDFGGIRTKTLEVVKAIDDALRGPLINAFNFVKKEALKFVDFLKGMWTRFQEDPVKAMGFLLGILIAWFIQLPGKVRDVVRITIKSISDLVSTAFEKFGPVVKDALEALPGVVIDFMQKLPGRLLGAMRTFQDWIRSFVEGIFEGIAFALPAGLLDPLKKLAGKLADIMDKVPGAAQKFIPGYSGLVDMLEDFSNLPGLARGGDVTRSGLAIVGERGQELVNLPKGAQVKPLTSAASQPQRIDLTIELDGEVLVKKLGLPLVEHIRLTTGVAI